MHKFSLAFAKDFGQCVGVGRGKIYVCIFVYYHRTRDSSLYFSYPSFFQCTRAIVYTRVRVCTRPFFLPQKNFELEFQAA